jgi:hypothetical protein
MERRRIPVGQAMPLHRRQVRNVTEGVDQARNIFGGSIGQIRYSENFMTARRRKEIPFLTVEIFIGAKVAVCNQVSDTTPQIVTGGHIVFTNSKALASVFPRGHERAQDKEKVVFSDDRMFPVDEALAKGGT